MNAIHVLFRAAALSGLPAVGLAATLTSVPMQGSMVMPMFAYHATEGRLTVQLDPTVPELTPLLVSNPRDSFDPADPWYDSLDPSRQGLAFSRRYGFVMDTLTDPLPPGTALWIRKVSSSPGLSAYHFRSGAAKLWAPIFGTDGVTNALLWDGTMFHPAFTAPPGSGAYTATFEAFLLDTASGLPVPGANTGPFSFHWTTAPDGRPALSLAFRPSRQIVLQWPAAASGWVLEAAETSPNATWTAVTNPAVQVEDQRMVTLETTAPARFFRLRLVP